VKTAKTLVETRCMEVNCPHWGWIKIPVSIIDFYYWQDCRDSGHEFTFTCPACGETHELSIW
jgi:hypothetical protein